MIIAGAAKNFTKTNFYQIIAILEKIFNYFLYLIILGFDK